MKKLNLHSITALFLLLIGITIFSSCEDDSSEVPMAHTECDCEQGDDDCTDNDVPTVANQIMGSWSAANEHDRHFITAPGNPSGGYFKVSLSESDPNLEPRLVVDTNVDVGGAIATAGSEVYAEYYPGVSYELDVYPFFNADQYPVDYVINYEFVGVADCFEPNDTFGTATKINIGSSYSASMVAGFQDYVVGSIDDHTYDWYRVETCEPQKLSVRISNVPNSMRIAARWINADEAQLLGSNIYDDEVNPFNRGSSLTNTMESEAPEGIYYLEVHGGFTTGRVAQDGAEIPSHFLQPYQIRVDAVE